jgi:MFS superfamily sulfate permease-like transporter
MNVSEPEADTEYSRAPSASRGRGRAREGGLGPVGKGVVAGGLLGAALLIAAEFLPLFEVRTSARNSVAQTVIAGSHHSWGLLPIGVLAAGLAIAWWRSPGRLPLVAMAVLGVAALVIALGRDLPDAQSSGLERSGGTYVLAAASPKIALYLETAGGVILLLSSGAGLMLTPRPNSQVQTI